MLFKKSRFNSHSSEVLKSAFLAFVLKVFGACVSFGFNVLIARLLGADGTGVYYLALSITAICSVVSRVGLDNTLLRFVSIHFSRKEFNEVQGVVSLSLKITMSISLIITVLGFFLAPLLAVHLFNKPELAFPLKYMFFSVLPFSLINLLSETLKGLKKITSAIFIQSIGIPLIGMLLIIPLVGLAGTLGVVFSYVFASLVIFVIALLIWQRCKKEFDSSDNIKYELDKVIKSCKPLFTVSLVNKAILPWAPLFLLGIWVTNNEVGIFGAATRISLMVSFTLMAVNNVLAPKFAELFAQEKFTELAEIVRKSALFITLLSSPLFLILIFFNEYVMSIFGKDFAQGGIVLAILAGGQFINSLTGSVNYLLVVTGNEKTVRTITVIGTIILLIFSVILMPLYGVVGAAIVVSVVRGGMNLSSAFMVYKKLGIISIPFLGKANASS